jgi:hypothetical protein
MGMLKQRSSLPVLVFASFLYAVQRHSKRTYVYLRRRGNPGYPLYPGDVAGIGLRGRGPSPGGFPDAKATRPRLQQTTLDMQVLRGGTVETGEAGPG